MSRTEELLTAEDLLAMPDDGVERMLIRGELREYPTPYDKQYHGHLHSLAVMQISFLLTTWLKNQSQVRGKVLGGDAAVRLSRDPDTAVSVDVALFTSDMLANTAQEQFFTEGPPLFAVEVLDDFDTIGAIAEKVDCYLEAGVALVWTVNPSSRIVGVDRHDAPPRSFDLMDVLDGGAELPGFRVAVSKIFE